MRGRYSSKRRPGHYHGTVTRIVMIWSGSPAALPVIERVYVPGPAFVTAESVELFPVVLAGSSVAVVSPPPAPPGTGLVTDSATLPVKPPVRLMLMVDVPAPPPSTRV